MTLSYLSRNFSLPAKKELMEMFCVRNIESIQRKFLLDRSISQKLVKEIMRNSLIKPTDSAQILT
ncbi:MAG: hypothetical protein MHPSP_002384, partial [Paramarteilia canceri]